MAIEHFGKKLRFLLHRAWMEIEAQQITMKLFFNETQLAHCPKQYMVHGRIVDPFENPNRATTLISSLERAGLQRTEPKDYGREPILMVHADHYVAFLEEAYARFMELRNPGPEVLPNVHPYRGASASFAGRGKPPDPGRST